MKTYAKKLILTAIVTIFAGIILSPLYKTGDVYVENNDYLVIYDLDTPLWFANNNSLRQIFEPAENGLLLDTEQLIENGGFENGTNEWTNYTPTASFTVTEGIATYISTGTDTEFFGQIKSLTDDKYYIISKHTQSGVNNYSLHIRMQNEPYTYVLEEALISTNGVQSHIFIVNTTTNYLIRYLTLAGEVRTLTSDYLYLFNITDLIDDEQYSPLFDTTYDLMNDADIQTQMDYFIENPNLYINFDELEWYPDQTQLEYFYEIYDILRSLENE